MLAKISISAIACALQVTIRYENKVCFVILSVSQNIAKFLRDTKFIAVSSFGRTRSLPKNENLHSMSSAIRNSWAQGREC